MKHARRSNHLTVLLATAATLLTLHPLPGRAQSSADSHHTEQELRRDTQKLLDAIAPGDVAVWDRLLDRDAIQVDENDVVRNRAAILETIKPLGAGLIGTLAIEEFRVVQKGNVAVTTHEDNERLDYHGQVILSRFRWTDTWVRKGQGWRLLASQVLAVQKDPPVANLAQTSTCEYSGTYSLTSDIHAAIRCNGIHLTVSRAERADRQFDPELRDVYFEPGEPRTRRIFLRDPTTGKVTGFVDRREGRDVYWKRSDS